MKKFTKLLGIVLIIALVMSMGISSAFAAEIIVASGSTAADGTASQDVLKGETYSAYKILNYTHSGDAWSYYLTSAQYAASNANGLGKLLESVGFKFTASSDGTQYYVNNGEELTESIASKLYAIKDQIASVAIASSSATAGSDKQAVFSGLDTGYWFVTSSLGALCSLQSYDDQAMIVEKNSIPGVDKTEKIASGAAAAADYVDGPVDANIGDTVNYQVVITDGVGTNAAITMKDTMTSGLTYTAGSIKINGTAVADNADVADNYKVTVDGQTITIVFAAKYVENLSTGGKITVTYDATINKDAVIDSATGNENKVELDYSNQHVEDKVYVETYDVTLKKEDGSSNPLNGAKFKLYTQETGGTALKFTKDSKGYYLNTAGSEEIDAGDGTGVNIRGLEPGTYWFEETEAPTGYNKLEGRRSVTVTKGATAAAEIIIINNSGTVLPSTGGIGTTIFYVVGSILVVAAGVLLVTKKRMTREG